MDHIAFGNTFDSEDLSFGHSRKVWREAMDQYPVGGTITNISDWVENGKVPAGTPVKCDMEKKEITAYTDAQITAAADVKTLGINGFMLSDTLIKDKNTVGSNTVIYHGEIYEWMLDADVVTKLKTLSTIPMIVFVQ